MKADGCASVCTDLMSGIIAGYIDHRENALEIYRSKLNRFGFEYKMCVSYLNEQEAPYATPHRSIRRSHL